MGSVFIDNEKANKAIDAMDTKGKGLSGTFGNMIEKATKLGAAMVVAGGLAVAAFGVASLKAAIDFEKQMASVATLLDGDVKTKVGNLGEAVKILSTKTGTSTAVLTDGLYQVVSAFGETEESMGILEVAAKGAAAGNASVTESVNLLSAVTKGYGDTSTDAMEKASDLAFLTVKLGQTTFPELASSMGKVIPLAGALKVSQEELFGAMATLTGVTGGTAEVTTQLRATLQSLMKPSKDMEKALQGMGYANGAAALESLGLQGVLTGLKDSVGGNETAFANMFSSVEAGTAALALTGMQADNFTAKTEAMKNAVGATDEAFKIQQQTVSAMMDKVKVSIGVVAISLGEKLLPLLQTFLNRVLEHMPQIEATISKMVDVVGKGISYITDTIIPSFMAGFNWVKENFDVIGPAMAAVFLTIIVPAFVAWAAAATTAALATIAALLPVMAPILAVGAAVAALALIWKTWGDDITRFVLSAVDGIVGTFIEFRIKITDMWADIVAKAASFKEAFVGIFRAVKDIVLGVWKGLTDGIKSGINFVINGINRFIDGINRISIPDWVPLVGGLRMNLPTIPALAEGGEIVKGGRVIVGEAGIPEIVDVPTGARVIPLDKVGTNITININDSYIMDDYGTDRLMDRIFARMRDIGSVTA